MNLNENIEEKKKRESEVEDEKEEVAQVVEADAVVYPDAVVVHVDYVALADVAVVTPVGF